MTFDSSDNLHLTVRSEIGAGCSKCIAKSVIEVHGSVAVASWGLVEAAIASRIRAVTLSQPHVGQVLADYAIFNITSRLSSDYLRSWQHPCPFVSVRVR